MAGLSGTEILAPGGTDAAGLRVTLNPPGCLAHTYNSWMVGAGPLCFPISQMQHSVMYRVFYLHVGYFVTEMIPGHISVVNVLKSEFLILFLI